MIDAHLQLGEDYIYDYLSTTVEDIKDVVEKGYRSGIVLYPGNSNSSIEIERKSHQVVLDYLTNNSNKVWGIARVNPNYDSEVYVKEVETYLNNGFSGISVSSQVYGWDPNSSKGELVFSTANKFSVPLFIPVGIGLPLGQPIKLFNLIKKYKNTKVVLVHAGKSVYGSQVNFLAEKFENVYLETSQGPNMRELKKYIAKFGSERVIMGSYNLDSLHHATYMAKNAGLTDDEFFWYTEKAIEKLLNNEQESNL